MTKPARTTFRTATLPRGEEQGFLLTPDAAARAALAGELGVSDIRKLRFEGRIVPDGRRDWRLEGRLGATVVQPCVITLEPVVTRIDEAVARRYLADWKEPEAGSEIEMPEDDTVEPLGPVIEPERVMAEALALAIPDYPRAEGAELGAVTAAGDGAEPIGDQKIRPFAGLGKLLKDKGN
jgi:uncharacterized metal-binding protein YceD (DUF177 family)